VRVSDGDHVPSGAILARVTGKARGILTAERTALNMLQHLSGIATLTAQYVKAIEGTGAQLVDTRKTTPGLSAVVSPQSTGLVLTSRLLPPKS